MGRVTKLENRTIVRTAQDWIDNVLTNVDPSPTVADIQDVSLGDSSVQTSLNQEAPNGNVYTSYDYAISTQDVIDNLLSQDLSGLTPPDIQNVVYDSSGSGSVTFTLKPLESEIGT